MVVKRGKDKSAEFLMIDSKLFILCYYGSDQIENIEIYAREGNGCSSI